MKVKAFEDFGDGLDVRKPVNLDDPTTLRVLENAYITQGKNIHRRPGLKKVGTIAVGSSSDEVGLCAVNGKLHTFSVNATGTQTLDDGAELITHHIKYDDGKASEMTVFDQRESRATGDREPMYVNFAGGFNRGMYASIKFGNNKSLHYYIPEDEWGGNSKSPIADSKCPHSSKVTIAQSKVYASDGETVAYCATGEPTDWSKDNDAGFLPTGDRSPGNSICTGLGVVSNRLCVFHEDAIQIWAVDPDPARNELEEQLAGIGTRHYQSITSASKDLYFLSENGVRSIGGQSMYRNMKGSDVGSPIDKIVREFIKTDDGRVDSQFYPGQGQYFLTLKDDTYVLTKSERDKIEAWSLYKFSIPFGQMAHLGEKLYVRYQDSIYVLDEDLTNDDGNQFNVVMESPFYGFGTEGQYKLFQSMEAILEGYGTIDHGVNPNNLDDRTASFQLGGDTRIVPSLPLGILAPALSTRIIGDAATLKSINSLIYRYEPTAGGI